MCTDLSDFFLSAELIICFCFRSALRAHRTHGTHGKPLASHGRDLREQPLELLEHFEPILYFFAFRGFCVPFIRPTDYPCSSVASVWPFSYLTQNSQNSRKFFLMRAFSVLSVVFVCLLSDPLISVFICGICVTFFLSHTELTDLTDIIFLDVSHFPWFPCVLCAFTRPHWYPCPSVTSVCPFLSHTELAG